MEPTRLGENEVPKHKSFFRKWLWLGIIFLVILIGVIAVNVLKPKESPQSGSPDTGSQTKSEAKKNVKRPVFTHQMIETDLVKFIMPLGELNGGYVELQPLNSVMIQLDQQKVKSGPGIEVFAPADMELINYAHTATDDQPKGDWSLEFRINENYFLTIHHLNNADEKITAKVGNTATKDDSRGIEIRPPLKFKAGDLIGTTKGTSLANNWNIYLYDKTTENKFVNQDRYKNHYLGQRLLAAVCPFDYYEDQTIKNAYYALLGSSKPGQSKTCGNPSSDKAGTLSGLWHLQKTGIGSSYEGDYADPLSVYMRSDGNVIIYELGRQFYTIPSTAKTHKNPQEITTSHCFNLADDWGGSLKQGYAYFRIDSETEMSAAFSKTGACPDEFPEIGAKKYYR